MTLGEVVQEADHVRGIKHMRHLTGDAHITRFDEEEAEIRLHKVRTKAAGTGGAPNWEAALIRLEANQALIVANQARIEARIVANQAITDAKFHNARARNWNSRQGPTTLLPLVKEPAGLGPRPAWGPRALPMPAAASAVGEVPTGFPVDTVSLLRLSKEDYARLAVFYNDTFGIITGDDDANRLLKFGTFIGYASMPA
ncbi:hypothetical protein DFS34DRAFT_634025 [Phlyctochytrium arcticum]|nr:hypothetical protein DFS34DRAFT_634025 [Phlyctochytrium arcticum]